MAYGDEIFNEHGQKFLEMNHQSVKFMSFIASRFWFVDVFPLRMYTFFIDNTLHLTLILSAVYPLLVPRGHISTGRQEVKNSVRLYPP